MRKHSARKILLQMEWEIRVDREYLIIVKTRSELFHEIEKQNSRTPQLSFARDSVFEN